MKTIKYLLLLGTMFLFLTKPLDAQWVQLGTDIDGEALADRSGWAVSMPDANTVAIGAIYNDDNGLESGHVSVYTWNGSTWVQKGADINGEVAYDYSGFSVSMPDANTVAIGAYNNAGNGILSGHVRIYKWNGSAWVQKGIDIDGEAVGDNSGCAVSMPDSNTVAIGARLNDGGGVIDAGHVRIYEWSGSAWVQKGVDIDGEVGGDQSGVAVSMPDANTVAIGAVLNDATGIDAGHVRVYLWNGSTWVQKGADIDGEAAGDFSGTSVSMPDANTVAIGGNGNDGNGNFSGHVRIYNWNGSAWAQKGIDIDGEAAADHSGYSVSMPDPNTVAIGAPGPAISGNAGHVRVFEWRGNAWVQKGMDMDGEAASDQFGNSVSMPDSNTVAIGGRQNDGFAFNAGHTRVYTFSGITRLTISTNSTNTSCGRNNGSATVTATGGTTPYTYLWDSNTGSQTDSTATNLAAGTYSVTVTDASGFLTAIDSVEVLSSSGPTIASTNSTSANCGVSNGSATVTPTGGTSPFTYQWDSNAGSQSDSTATGLSGGSYTVTITDASGCALVDTVTVQAVGSLSIVSSKGAAICMGDSTQLSISGATNITWSTGATTSSIYVKPNQGASYSVSGTTPCGTATENITISVNSLLSPAITANDTIICAGESTQICIPDSFVSYVWSNGGASYCTQATFAGGYWVSVTAANGCSTVSQREDISIYPVPSVAIIRQGDTLSSFGAVSYQWYYNGQAIPGATSSIYIAKDAGNYSVEITDGNGCKAVSSPVVITGIHDILLEGAPVIFPNPASDLLQIKAGLLWAGQGFVLNDVIGQIIAQGLLAGEYTHVPISQLPAGLYYVKINNLVLRFMKQ